jgi:hypothetical protein
MATPQPIAHRRPHQSQASSLRTHAPGALALLGMRRFVPCRRLGPSAPRCRTNAAGAIAPNLKFSSWGVIDISCRLPRRSTLFAQNPPATPSDDDGGGIKGDAGQAHPARGPGGAAGGLAVPHGRLHGATVPRHEARRAPAAGGAGRAVRAPRRASWPTRSERSTRPQAWPRAASRATPASAASSRSTR